MKINRKIQNFGLIIIGGLALIGLIIGTFLDKQITVKMGDNNNLFGIILTAFAPVLTLAFGVLAGALLFFMPKIEHKTLNIVFRVIGVLAVVGFIFFQTKEGLEWVEFPRMESEAATYKALIIVFISILDLAVILFSRIWVNKMDHKAMLYGCLMIIAIIVVYFVACEGVKYIASRPRPRNLDAEFNGFKRWYQFNPFGAFNSELKDQKSFVSGHTANAACLITILPFVASMTKRENDNRIQIMTIVIGGLFTFVVAFSRIIARAHWMSDVMGGILLSCAIQALAINVKPFEFKKD
jgi:membrane-associated phospholipid phosphatase